MKVTLTGQEAWDYIRLRENQVKVEALEAQVTKLQAELKWLETSSGGWASLFAAIKELEATVRRAPHLSDNITVVQALNFVQALIESFEKKPVVKEKPKAPTYDPGAFSI